MPVYLRCELLVNIERATSSERRYGGTTKLTDAKLLEGIISRSENSLFESGLEMFTTHVSAKEVAQAILAAVADEGFQCQRGGLVRDHQGQPADVGVQRQSKLRPRGPLAL
jgi:hypothetical protein